jgi:hypothetical protein
MKKKTTKANNAPSEIVFHYIKTSNYRSYHVDGFYGGLTPKGNLYAELFIERKATPQKEIYKIKANKFGPTPDEKEGKEGFIREIEAGLVMDYQTMLALKKWLDERIIEYQSKFQEHTKH